MAEENRELKIQRQVKDVKIAIMFFNIVSYNKYADIYKTLKFFTFFVLKRFNFTYINT